MTYKHNISTTKNSISLKLLMMSVGVICCVFIMTSWNGDIFSVTDPLWGESNGHRWISPTKASDAEIWCFIWSPPEKNRLSKQSRRRWFETPSCSLWRHCSDKTTAAQKLCTYRANGGLAHKIHSRKYTHGCFPVVSFYDDSLYYIYICIYIHIYSVQRYFTCTGVAKHITVTSLWARWRLKSPASRLFVQPLIRHRSKEASKFRVTGLCWGNPSVAGILLDSPQKASNAENVSIWWRHHAIVLVPMKQPSMMRTSWSEQSTAKHRACSMDYIISIV